MYVAQIIQGREIVFAGHYDCYFKGYITVTKTCNTAIERQILWSFIICPQKISDHFWMLQSHLFELRQKLENVVLPDIGEFEKRVLYMEVTLVNDY